MIWRRIGWWSFRWGRSETAAFLHARLVETGGRGVQVRRLGGSRQGPNDKRTHPKGSFACPAWVCARLGGWTGYCGKPGPVVMLKGWIEFQAAKRGAALSLRRSAHARIAAAEPAADDDGFRWRWPDDPRSPRRSSALSPSRPPGSAGRGLEPPSSDAWASIAAGLLRPQQERSRRWCEMSVCGNREGEAAREKGRLTRCRFHDCRVDGTNSSGGSASWRLPRRSPSPQRTRPA
jgi:hypothetical protein